MALLKEISTDLLPQPPRYRPLCALEPAWLINMLKAAAASRVASSPARDIAAQTSSNCQLLLTSLAPQVVRDKSKLGLMGAGGLGVTDRALTYLDGSLPGE